MKDPIFEYIGETDEVYISWGGDRILIPYTKFEEIYGFVHCERMTAIKNGEVIGVRD